MAKKKKRRESVEGQASAIAVNRPWGKMYLFIFVAVAIFKQTG